MRSFNIAAALLGLGSLAFAAVAEPCTSSDLCSSLDVSSTVASLHKHDSKLDGGDEKHSWQLENVEVGDHSGYTVVPSMASEAVLESRSTTTNTSAPFGGDTAFGDKIIRIHGALASLAFVGFFPIGGILIRIANFTGVVWVHAALQAVAYTIYFAAFGCGVYLMKNLNNTIPTHAHPGLGGILFIVLLSQPITGYMHHRLFARRGGRTTWSHIHLFIGRAAVFLGIANGGLGIHITGNVSTGGKVAYGIFAVGMMVLYVASIIIGERRVKRRNLPPSYDLSQKTESERLGDEAGMPGAVPLPDRFT